MKASITQKMQPGQIFAMPLPCEDIKEAYLLTLEELKKDLDNYKAFFVSEEGYLIYGLNEDFIRGYGTCLSMLESRMYLRDPSSFKAQKEYMKIREAQDEN